MKTEAEIRAAITRLRETRLPGRPTQAQAMMRVAAADALEWALDEPGDLSTVADWLGEQP